MKISKARLKKIILEEANKTLEEANFLSRFLNRSSEAAPDRSVNSDDDGAEKKAPKKVGLGADKLRELQSYTCPDLKEFLRQIVEPAAEAFQTGRMSEEEYDHNVAVQMQVRGMLRKKGCSKS
jgi:hypothetical protein